MQSNKTKNQSQLQYHILNSEAMKDNKF